ncbi:hypothetical protein [Flavisolibacter ginsenosidimutans]|uniref:Uncharacterized protein n=1 Tax=Flavisolibacter ginsenosidimutans TaxID=661481 RepID=A0A5B8UMQ6_9BACT|nr:hypothetical protein [Flavisolibacter ginsenosidimutans]QEC57961.1 hypothetical protein FSB75_19295 [Flavisolibacter ginsenosidimutans]
MKQLLTILFAVFFLQAAAQIHPTLPRKHFVLNLSNIRCLKTTEEGEDEVYLLLVWRHSDGSTGSVRLPSEHWDMNDGDKLKNARTENNVFSFDLMGSERVEVLCLLMEQDDGTVEQYANLGAEVLRIVESGYSSLSGFDSEQIQSVLKRITGTYNLKNSDDWIGGFAMRYDLTRTATWLVRANPNGGGETSGWGTDFSQFTLKGDGSKYEVRVNVKTR